MILPQCDRVRVRAFEMQRKSPQQIAAAHLRRARYLRIMARDAYRVGTAITLIQLALHYEQLALEADPATVVKARQRGTKGKG